MCAFKSVRAFMSVLMRARPFLCVDRVALQEVVKFMPETSFMWESQELHALKGLVPERKKRIRLKRR